MSGPDAGPETSYVIKRVPFFSRDVPIFLQNENGPCPLLAIANVLSLRRELKLPARLAGSRQISEHDLISLVADRLLTAGRAYESSAPEYAEANLADSFEVLSKLTTGVDVNVKFHSIHAFEPTKEVAVFDLLGIDLVHGTTGGCDACAWVPMRACRQHTMSPRLPASPLAMHTNLLVCTRPSYPLPPRARSAHPQAGWWTQRMRARPLCLATAPTMSWWNCCSSPWATRRWSG